MFGCFWCVCFLVGLFWREFPHYLHSAHLESLTCKAVLPPRSREPCNPVLRIGRLPNRAEQTLLGRSVFGGDDGPWEVVGLLGNSFGATRT